MGIYDRGYYQDDQWKQGGAPTMRPARSMVITIIIINAAIFAIDVFSPRIVQQDSESTASERSENKTQWVSHTLSLKYGISNFGYPGPFENPLYFWQLLSYGFAHSSIGSDHGIFHIAFNMFTLFFLGRAVEQRYGPQEFIKFYLIAIVVAGFAWLCSRALTGGAASAVGASGAVAAVVILFVLNFPKETVYLFGVIGIPAWILGVVLVGFDILNSLNSESQIAVEAHLGGALFAAAYFYGKWNFRWLRFNWLADRFSGKPRLKVHKPDGGTEKLSEQADEILEKLHTQGEESLTRRERKILERYSKNVRDRRDS